MQPEYNLDVIGSLPSKVIVHDLSFDWCGKRIAVACSDRIVRIYIKEGVKWVQQSDIKIQGASVWKVKWARPQFGIFLATCSLDRIVRIFEWKRVQKNENQKNDWVSIHPILESRTVQDIKFVPFKDHGLALAIVTSDGFLKIYQPHDSMRPKEWSLPKTLLINQLGVNCLSWSKNILKEDMVIALGCKGINTSPRRVLIGMKNQPGQQPFQLQAPSSTIAFACVQNNEQQPNKQLVKIGHSIKQNRTINDISWALMNGRSYYLLAVASQNSMKVYQLNIKEPLSSIQLIRQNVLSQMPSFRVSWNVMGNYISVSEKKKIRIWRFLSRSVWNEVKEIQQTQ